MNIDIGKSYLVGNELKDSYIKRLFFSDDSKLICNEIRFKTVVVKITPSSEEEVKCLTKAIQNGGLEFSDYEKISVENRNGPVSSGWVNIVGDTNFDDVEKALDEDDELFEIEEVLNAVYNMNFTHSTYSIEGPLTISLV